MEHTVILQRLLGVVQGCTRFLEGKNILSYVRFEVLTAVTVKSVIFWDVGTEYFGRSLSTFRKQYVPSKHRQISARLHNFRSLMTIYLGFTIERAAFDVSCAEDPASYHMECEY